MNRSWPVFVEQWLQIYIDFSNGIMRRISIMIENPINSRLYYIIDQKSDKIDINMKT